MDSKCPNFLTFWAVEHVSCNVAIMKGICKVLHVLELFELGDLSGVYCILSYRKSIVPSSQLTRRKKRRCIIGMRSSSTPSFVRQY